MVAVRSDTLAWTVATMGALIAAAALIAVVVGGGDGSDGNPAPDDSTPLSEPVIEATDPPVPIATTTTSLPVSTTLALTTPELTTTTALATTTEGYTYVPKPATGPNTIGPGGALTKHLAEDIASAFGFDLAEVTDALDRVDLPPEAGGNPEGWLAPGTYSRGGGAREVVQAMVDRRVSQLEARGVPREEWHEVITAASVIEKETYNQNEKPRVARVLVNRLAGGGPLQMDSIILYPIPEDRIFTTSEERGSEQPYNSYRHDGLPPTPISAPDEESIDAFLDPPPGDWWFYVTVDLNTGETRYAVTYEEHLGNVEELRTWLRDNPTE